MIICMIANLVAFIDDSPNEPRVTFGVDSDQKKSCLHVRPLQDIENLRSPLRIGPVIEGERNLMFVPAP